MLEDFGKLTVRAYTAGGGLPVSGARVLIVGGEELNKDIKYELLTDRDGVTDTLSLPTPKKGLSLSPDPSETPYALYDIEITKEGYFTRSIRGVSVFSGVNSLQLINMIPYSGEGLNEYPRGNINTVIPKNRDL